MSLVFEIDFLTGVCRAAREPGDATPDWPPQPDRVFSALVSAWAARGERSEERAALEWLEAQSSPTIYASDHTPRTTPDVFVPPNDFQTPGADLERLIWYRDFLKRGRRPSQKGGREREWKRALSTLPEFRQGQKQGRSFPVARPDDPVVALAWSEEPEAGTFDALDTIARDVGYIGHSASLTRCRFLSGGGLEFKHPASHARRRIYPGRLCELEDLHRQNPIRPAIRPGPPVFAERSSDPQPPDDWLVLETIDGEVPDIRAAALVCRLLRQTLMSGYRKAGERDAIPEVVSGHAPDGTPTKLPHLAMAPMAFAGFPHADGRVLGFAIIPPRGMPLDHIEGFRTAFEKVAPYREKEERRVMTLEGSPLGGPLCLAPAPHTGTRMQSLLPDHYLEPARLWASVTPIVLERHLKRKDDVEVRELVARACENAGLPRPDLGGIQIGKHSSVEGIPPARRLAGEPPWMRWKAPNPLASRPLIHAFIDFEEEIPGPVLLGAGRFTGLGLCRRIGS